MSARNGALTVDTTTPLHRGCIREHSRKWLSGKKWNKQKKWWNKKMAPLGQKPETVLHVTDAFAIDIYREERLSLHRGALVFQRPFFSKMVRVQTTVKLERYIFRRLSTRYCFPKSHYSVILATLLCATSTRFTVILVLSYV